MLNRILIILPVIVLFFGCESGEDITVLNDIEEKYTAEPATQPEIQNDDNEINEVFNDNLDVKKLTGKEEGSVSFDIQLYLDAEGEVRYVKGDFEKAGYSFGGPDKKELTVDENYFKSSMIKVLEYLDFKAGLDSEGNKIPTRSYLIVDVKLTEYDTPAWKITLADRPEHYGSSRDIPREDFFVAVEEMPSIKGGMQNLASKIDYPAAAKEQGIEGKVFIKAYVDTTGKVSYAEVIKGIGYGCDEEALNAVYNTEFNPGKQRGKKVKVQVVVPIIFALE